MHLRRSMSIHQEKQATAVAREGAIDPTAISLDKLGYERCGTVVAIDASDADVNRLAGMGVCIGRLVRIVKLGDPLILRALGSRIGLSLRLGRRISVLPCLDPCREPSEVPELSTGN